MRYYQNQFSAYPWHDVEQDSAVTEYAVVGINDAKHYQSWSKLKHKGLRWYAGCSIELVAELNLDTIEVIEIEFPKFTDGSGYSIAYRLRNDYEYKGLLVARGEVLIDQIALMKRCGIEGFLLSKTYAIESIKKALYCAPETPQSRLFY